MTMAASDRHEVGTVHTDASVAEGGYTISWVASDEGSLEARCAEPLARYLAQAVRTREPLHIRLEHARQDCTGADHIDLRVRLDADHQQVIVQELVIQGATQAHAIALGVGVDEAQTRIARLFKAYLVERCQRDTFATWVRELPVGVVKSRLGV